MSRSLLRLEPEFREKLELVIETAKNDGVHMVPYETERHVDKQAKLWRQSRSAASVRQKIHFLRDSGAPFLAEVLDRVGPCSGGWATNALPGQSWHQWGQAADLYWDSNGPAPGGVEWSNLKGYEIFARIARDAGLTSGFFWKSRDAVHVQLPTESKPSLSLREISQAMEARFGGK